MSYKTDIIRADGPSEIRLTPEKLTLDELQEIVGGHIEIVYVRHLGHRREMIVNDEGHLVGLPLNRAASAIYCGPIAGDVALLHYELD